MRNLLERITRITQESQGDSCLREAITKMRQAAAHYEQGDRPYTAANLREEAARIERGNLR